jgi:alcohol dehydrogenase
MQDIPAFSLARLPRIVFGDGTINRVPELASGYGQRALLVTGQRSFRDSPRFAPLVSGLQRAALSFEIVNVSGEPSPALVDEAVAAHHGKGIKVVIAIGGGSVLDAAKAIAGLLPFGNSVMDHLEGVGQDIEYRGPATPFIAVPTTAGTGSEATKNAVLSVQGENGFKKSFRHDSLVPAYAVVDPELLETCTPELMAANGMDALTQLMESYVSTNASPFTDALALSGVEAWRDGFFAAWSGGAGDAARNGRRLAAYGSLLSGITLAQAGLGSVHGLASPLGAFFPIPHGVVCGTLVAKATAVNIRALLEREPKHPALAKYARLAERLTGRHFSQRTEAHETLIETLEKWTVKLALPSLGRYGMRNADVSRIVTGARGASMKTNPVSLTDTDIAGIIQSRL